jgi:hypothetical protein
VYFGNDRLLQKVISGERWRNTSRFRRYADSYLGYPASKLHKYWPGPVEGRNNDYMYSVSIQLIPIKDVSTAQSRLLGDR